MREDALLTGVLEPTNEPYAIAKIAGIKLCESYNRQHGTDYRSVMPTNLYGPGDNFHPENSHVLPALIRRFHEAAQSGAKEVVIWGSGTPRREFLHVDDMAAASLFVLDLPKADYEANTQPMLSHINVGSGTDISILELAQKVAADHRLQGTYRDRPVQTRRNNAQAHGCFAADPDGLVGTDRVGSGPHRNLPMVSGITQTLRVRSLYDANYSPRPPLWWLRHAALALVAQVLPQAVRRS